MPQPVITVVGPTATGKSGLSLRLASALGGEIVNADSMQLYRGMDIGTAKLAPAERDGVPHHLLDVWDVTMTASVSEYQQLARTAVGEIRERGRIPILTGGSGLYIRAAIDNLEFPGTDQVLRDSLEAELDRRIAARVSQMWQAGFVAEVRDLAGRGLREGRTASRALGYAQVLRFLAGDLPEEQAAAETVRATCRFARRQEAWFRRDPRIRWLAASDPGVAGLALALLRESGLRVAGLADRKS